MRDLFQLEPVSGSYIFIQQKTGFMPLASNIWTDLFNMFELKQIMRQAESKQFAELLNRLREGHQTFDDLNILKSRVIKRDSPDYPHDATHLMYTNQSVDAHNSQVILRSENPAVTISAKDRVNVGSTPPNMCQLFFQNFRKHHAKKCQLPNVVVVVYIGIFYDLTVNMNTEDGLTNGASCQVMKVDNSDTYASGTIWVNLLDTSIGKALRSEALYKAGYDKSWIPIQPVLKELSEGKNGRAQIQIY